MILRKKPRVYGLRMGPGIVFGHFAFVSFLAWVAGCVVSAYSVFCLSVNVYVKNHLSQEIGVDIHTLIYV